MTIAAEAVELTVLPMETHPVALQMVVVGINQRIHAINLSKVVPKEEVQPIYFQHSGFESTMLEI